MVKTLENTIKDMRAA
nr:unnamed protein product [Callosobruchus analis]